MKKGDTVTIYQRPLTEEEEEGQAELIEFVYAGDDIKFEYWKVKFLGGEDGDPTVYRFIKKK